MPATPATPTPPASSATPASRVSRATPDAIVGATADDEAQPPLPLASEGVQRWLWHSRFGDMLIEVVDGEVFVNGQRVQRHAP